MTARSCSTTLLLTAALALPLVGCAGNRANTAPTDGGGLNQQGEIETAAGGGTVGGENPGVGGATGFDSTDTRGVSDNPPGPEAEGRPGPSSPPIDTGPNN